MPLPRDVRRSSELRLIHSGHCWLLRMKTRHNVHRYPYEATATVMAYFPKRGKTLLRVSRQALLYGLRFWCAATAIRTRSSPWKAWSTAPELSWRTLVAIRRACWQGFVLTRSRRCGCPKGSTRSSLCRSRQSFPGACTQGSRTLSNRLAAGAANVETRKAAAVPGSRSKRPL